VARKQEFTAKPDPVEALDQTLHDAWETICDTLDIVAEMPTLSELVEDAPLDDAAATAERVVVNMLAEGMAWVCRFSPWYTQPARAYGLDQTRDKESGQVLWELSAQGLAQWEPVLIALASAFRGQAGLLRMLLLVDELMEAEGKRADECEAAACRCLPPKVILVQREILGKTDILCEMCRAPFRVIDRRC
jgi:hypothetical protein